MVLMMIGSMVALGAGAASGTVQGGAAPPLAELWLDVVINGEPTGMAVRVARRPDGGLFASADDLARWRIRVPAASTQALRGRQYIALDAVAGLTHEIDERTQTLVLHGRPDVFLPTLIRPHGPVFARPDRTASGGLLNYDLHFQRQGGLRRLDGLFEFGLFNPAGFATATFLGRGLDGERGFTRLDTAWTRDDPDRMRSLRLGDSIGRADGWARAVRFAGVQWGTDFATRPDFVHFPLPTLAGEAVLPSTVDVYVDNALRLTRKVPYGPFAIADLPVVTGEGEVRLVVRDALGRETVTVQPYYASPGILAAGLHDYTYEAGFERERYARASDDYGRFFAAGTHRYGLSERITIDGRGEFLADQHTVGLGATFAWPALGVANAAVAASRSSAGRGGLLALGVERRARPLSFGFQAQWASARFAQLGSLRDRPPARQRSVARLAYAFGRAGALFATHVRQARRVEPGVEFLSAGYNATLPGGFHLSVFAIQSLVGERDRGLGITLTRSLGARTSASGSFARRDGEAVPGFSLQRSLPPGRGVGYRVGASEGERPRRDAALFAQSDIGTYGVELARIGDVSGERLSARGGVALLGGAVHLARRLDESFAVVRVGDYPGVEVMLENQPVARTRGDGTALVPALRPYQRNNLAIAQDALPLDAELGALRLSATPARRSGVLVDFPVRATRGALLRIVLDDGEALPAGAQVRLRGATESFPVALRGEAWVTGLSGDDELIAAWKGRSCMIRVIVPRDAGPLPVVGPLLCRGVAR